VKLVEVNMADMRRSDERPATYVVHLRVEVAGPDAEWDEVAHRLATRVESLRRRDGYGIVSVRVDAAEDVD
jgi:hypothetical protein